MIGLKNGVIRATVVAMGLAATAAFAAPGTVVSVKLPESVNIGDKVLPSGEYKISEVQLAGRGASAFVIRDDNGRTAAVVDATRTAAPPHVNSLGIGQKTEVVLTADESGTVRLNDLFLEGDTTGYRFIK